MIEAIGYAAGFLATLSCVPQVIKSWRSRSVGDLSLLMLLMLAAGLILWIVYGVIRGDRPIIVWNVVSLALWSSLLVLKLRRAGGRGSL